MHQFRGCRQGFVDGEREPGKLADLVALEDIPAPSCPPRFRISGSARRGWTGSACTRP